MLIIIESFKIHYRDNKYEKTNTPSVARIRTCIAKMIIISQKNELIY